MGIFLHCELVFCKFSCIKSVFSHFWYVLGCGNIILAGNGFCNDETNFAECRFDGGDCCLNVNTDHCTVCACYLQEICAAGFHPSVGDGFCNDETNIADCSYDGGDCCGSCVNTDYCEECTCLAGDSGNGIYQCSTSGAITSPGYPQNYDNNLDLYWLIQAPIGQTIVINFISFDVEYHSSCG